MELPITLGEKPVTSSQTFPAQLLKLGSDEIVLVELQGSLEVTGEKEGGLIGTMSMKNPDRPTLQIGHHLLEGKIVSLPKPLSVLRVIRSQGSSATPAIEPAEDIAMDDVEEDIASAPQAATSFEIITTVRRKILFSKRPRPIVRSAQVPK